MTTAASVSAIADDPVTQRLVRVYGAELLRAERRAYVSTPITTGLRFVEWWDREGRMYDRDSVEFSERRLRSVIEPNIARAKKLARRIEHDLLLPVINPAKLEDVEGWEQDAYHSFWAEVIRRYVDVVVFLKGWEFSTGCVIEFGVARADGRALLTEELEPLTDDLATTLVSTACNDLRARGLAHREQTALVRSLCPA